MLSPAETSGLAGAALESRVQQACAQIGRETLARIDQRLRTDATANRILYDHEGTAETVRIMLRPILAMGEQLGYINHVCLRITEALKRTPSLYFSDPAIRRLLAVTPDEEAFLRQAWTQAHERANPVFGRLDAVCDFAGAFWRESLQFMEPNLSGVGGIYYAPMAERLILRDILPTLQAHDPDLRIELPADQRDILVEILMGHAKAIGRPDCKLCFVEPKYVAEGPNEQAILTEMLAKSHGLTVCHADPSELEVRGEEVYYRDQRIDVVYRDYEMRDLVALERDRGRPLDGMRTLFRQNRVVSSLAGDFDHKSAWELLTDPAIAERLYSLDDCRLFRRHVLWTRAVSERQTSLPDNRQGDLAAFIRQNREQLVLKPNRGYGGKGVTIGLAASQSAWETALGEALSLADDPEKSWVVQQATRIPVHEFPVLAGDGRVHMEPFYTVMGFAASENGLGSLCRVSQKQVVNVAQHGGLAAVLVAHPPRDLTIPKRFVAQGSKAAGVVRDRIKDLLHFDQVIALLGWDEETMLPPKGRVLRGEQLATVEAQRHALLASDELGDLIGETLAEVGEDATLLRELHLLQRQRRLALSLDEGLVRAFANCRSQSLGAWEEARAAGDFAEFAPAFGRLLEVVRERARALAQGEDIYDGVLDEYEPGMKRARLEPVLFELRDGLVPLVREAAERQPHRPAAELPALAEPKQWDLARALLGEIGFDFQRGRLDRSTHPFTLMAGDHDVRLTIRIDERDPTKAVLTALHEGGHGLYDQGLTQGGGGRLINEASSMGMHEAQARLWENHVGRDLAFWQHLAPRLPRQAAGGSATAGVLHWHRAVNAIRRSTNRVSADVLTYHLHILLRYELEQKLLAGDLAIADLPGAWTERSLALLGVAPASDREGVLQDVHWSLGMFGYFPSYSVGSLYAAQLIEAYGRSGDLQAEIGRGDFAPLKAWLYEHVHRHGNSRSSDELMQACTGRGLEADAFFGYARKLVAAAG